MAKRSGLGDNLAVNGVLIGGDVNNAKDIGGGNTPFDFTDITRSAMVRQGGQRSARIDYTAFHNVTGAHLVLAPLSTADQVTSYMVGATIGLPIFTVVDKQMNYDPKRAVDGSLMIDVSTQSNGYGGVWGDQLTNGARTDTAATNGASLDYGATIGSTAFGAEFVVHLGALTGTDITVKVQHSNDDGSTDPYADITGATSGSLTTAPQGIWAVTSLTATIKRYVRVVTTTSGGFTSATFVAGFTKNLTTTAF